MIDYADLVNQCDRDIKAAKPLGAIKRVASINTNRVPREWRLPLARICRRCGHYRLGLKLLSSLMHKDTAEPDQREIAEYAVLLQRSGALDEALERLNQVDPTVAPEATLYRAYIHFGKWDFATSVPILREYLGYALDDYQRIVGQLNLAFALVESQNFADALSLLTELSGVESSQARSNRHALLGQVRMHEGDYVGARNEFALAQKMGSGATTNDQFFAEKWRLILSGLETRDTKWFDRLRLLAAKNRSWEALREADLYALKVRYVRERFVYLYCGTPFPGFRDRMAAELGAPPTQHSYVLGQKSTPRLDLRTGTLNGQPILNPGRMVHQLVNALLEDFYRPLRIEGLFAKIFSPERFNVTTSPHRVHQLISRSRAWLKDVGLPVAIVEDRSFYRLHIVGDISITVPMDRQPVHLTHQKLSQLRSNFGPGESFSATDAQTRLKLAKATVHRLIHRGLTDGDLEIAGKENRTTRYRVRAA